MKQTPTIWICGKRPLWLASLRIHAPELSLRSIESIAEVFDVENHREPLTSTIHVGIVLEETSFEETMNEVSDAREHFGPWTWFACLGPGMQRFELEALELGALELGAAFVIPHPYEIARFRNALIRWARYTVESEDEIRETSVDLMTQFLGHRRI